MEFFRFVPMITVSAAVLLPLAMAAPMPQTQTRFFNGFPGFQPPTFQNNAATGLVGAGQIGAGIFAASNLLNPSGNNGNNGQISVRPTLGVNVGANGAIQPNVGAAVQVGNNDVNPTFNAGIGFDQTRPNGISPFLGSGISFGQNNGGVNPALNSGFGLNGNNQATPQVGGSIGFGNLFSFNTQNLGR